MRKFQISDRPLHARIGIGLAAAIFMGGCQSGPPSNVRAKMFDQKQPAKRRLALTRTAQASFGGKPAYLKAYRHLADDPNITVRAAAAYALGKRGKVEDAKVLADLLDDDSTFVRWNAAQSLQAIHNPVVVDALVAATRDDDGDVRSAATKALGQYPHSNVFQTLVGKLTDNNYAVQRAAYHSLVTLTGKQLGPEPADWLDWAQANRNQLFADQQIYTYQPWVSPPNWLQRLVYWGDSQRSPAQGQRPTGT